MKVKRSIPDSIPWSNPPPTRDERVRELVAQRDRARRAEKHPEFFEGWGFHDDWDGWTPVDPQWVKNAYITGLVRAERKSPPTDGPASATR